MECNKDEALRAKSIAEGKLERKDYAGAKKFVLKAQSLYPGLDGISQMLTTVNVYISAENKIGGEVDWYGVLGVNPSDDDEMLRKQYRKLALTLHPDKNKSVGSDGAFKLVSEAWCMLSDKTKRLSYNQRGGSKGFQQKGSMRQGGPSAPSKENGNFNIPNRATSGPKTQKNSAKPPQTSRAPPPSRRTDTFWTICRQCLMHYEYLKHYRNQTLLCPNCHKPFLASETNPPFNMPQSSNQVPRHCQQTSSDHNASRNVNDLGRDAPGAQKTGQGQAGSNSTRYYHHHPLSGTGNISSSGPSIAAKAANVVQQAQDKLKRAYTESHASAGWSEHSKKRNMDEGSNQYGMNYSTTQGNGGLGTLSGSVPGSRTHGPSITSSLQSVTRDLSPYELRKILIERTRNQILNKLTMQCSETTGKALNKQKGTSKENKKEWNQSVTDISGQNRESALNGIQRVDRPSESRTSFFAYDNGKDDLTVESISVPDPDFHDFDQDRMESSFGENEVWAAYDDDDGMPRLYALINKVISRKPFKLRISWLNSKTNSEFSNIEWVGSGFYKTCGEFRVGKYEISETINSFSHKVNWSKGSRGSILIYPQKGDIWALYKNWSPDWDENTPDEVIHKYDMVMVLDDYNEDQGITVAPLVKVLNLKTVFRPNMDSCAMRRISKQEMFRFSHRVPTHMLTGLESQNAPKGCLELDPAATPLELLQVMTESDDPDCSR